VEFLWPVQAGGRKLCRPLPRSLPVKAIQVALRINVVMLIAL
jgi:hypothetical protein